MNLEEAVLKLDEKAVRQCFEEDPQCLENTEESGLLLHRMLLSVDSGDVVHAAGRKMVIYILRNHGLDVNTQDHGGNTALHLTVERLGDAEMCEALLQCGADMYVTNKIGVSALDQAVTHAHVPVKTRELFKKYKPGLWRAVEEDDLMSVRKLVNLWCRVDLVKDGRTLKEAVLDKGTEDMIRLIIDITPSMCLAHSVMAGDVTAVEQLCNKDLKLNYNFKNMGDMGATPLFYAIMQNNYKMVELLYHNGAKIDVTITFEEQDVPLYFIALHNSVDTSIINCLTPHVSEMPTFTDMHYQGLNAVHFAVENGVSHYAIKYILQQGFPQLLCMRDQSDLCPREVAQMLGNSACVSAMDEVVHEWYLDNNNEQRKILALYGYRYLREAQKDGVCAYEVIQSMETGSEQAKFDSQLDTYQDQISRLHEAVECGDFNAVQALLYYTSEYPQCFHSCLANSFSKANGQPLIHKAVLRRHTRVVELICQTLVNTLKVKLDSVWDAWHRTALHYAYGIPEGKQIIYILQDFGCSDFTMDKDGRSPLVFYDHRHHPEMSQLILHHTNRDYTKAEPHPWTVKKIQIIGGGSGPAYCRHSDRMMPRHWNFHEGFLMRLLKMGEESESEDWQQQRAIQPPDEDADDDAEDSYHEEQKDACDNEPGVKDGETYQGVVHLPRTARRHSHSCILL